ncbi:hypothetical protein [Ovoidimarina sediminis]|uniref:hypothetical protein n=1 Tax=Ovoidimarina sediminis TaxID=3079856 RepID=UPI002908326D|nr:hypothetical protein [Rhodophyticola sp. MJ-SS7]MDU8943934.1 hypothetical protein [Rhodophyticola sp. MJ-SS7]
MTMMSPVENFGYQDFLLVEASQEMVLRALAESLADAEPWGGGFDPENHKPSLFFRLLMRIMGMRAADGPWNNPMAGMSPDPDMVGRLDVHMMFTGAEAEGAPLTRDAPPANAGFGGFAADFDDLRISRVTGHADLTVVEMREMASGMSMTAFGVSSVLSGADVLYFRRSGEAAAEKNYDFHLYRDGDVVRRVLCHATWAGGKEDGAWWEGISDGAVTRYEPAGLYVGAGEADLLDNRKIDAILGTLGLTATRLFGPDGREAPVLFAKRAGGAPLPR